jgi:CubicO group peptidase (beta-lactamase class C family)
VEDRIRRALVAEGVPSLAVAAARDGEIHWEAAFGWADRERRVLATPHTLYSLASISKPITATAVMLLHQRGLLDPDLPVNRYLGDAKLATRVGGEEEATVRRVANHTSGLPLHCHFFYADEPYQRPSMDETLRRYGNLITAPGERFQYSNLGYGVLDYLITRLSGTTYADFMREEVFLPLGMNRAAIGVPPRFNPFQATRYGSDGVPYPAYDFDHPGGSAVYCSAHDLVRFGLLHLKTLQADQRRILNDEQIDAMQVATADREGGGYGFGWNTREDEHGFRTVSHSGGMGGVATLLKLVPSERIAVVALANSSCTLPGKVAADMLAALLPAYGARRSAEEAKPPEPPPAFAPFGGASELEGEWAGTVRTHEAELPLTLWFKADGDVHARLGAQLTALVNDVTCKDGWLSGCFLGDLGTEDANRRPYHLHLDLKLRGDVLNGALVAKTVLAQPQGGAPGRRMGNALSHWTEVRRA